MNRGMPYVAGEGCTEPESWPRATCANPQINPMISVQMATLFVMFVTSDTESSHFREASGARTSESGRASRGDTVHD